MNPGEEKRGAIQAQLEVLYFLSDSTDDYLFLGDFETGKLFFSKNINKRYQVLPEGKDSCTLEEWYSIVYRKDLAPLRREMERVFQGKVSKHDMEYRLVDRDGNRVWVSCRGRCQTDEQGKPIAIIGRVSDTVLERKVDPLTGAFNAGKLTEDMERILSSGVSCFLLMVGIDNLKSINIRHGREYGSRVLRLVADTMDELVGTGLRIYRFNGDCFAVNIPGQEAEQVEQIYEQLRGRLAEHCTISAGVVSYSGHQNIDASALYQYAEDTLDKAKRMGKNTIAFFSQKDYEVMLSRIELQEELHQSIQDGFLGFSLCYQPQIHAGSYDLYGVESLLRYTSPTRGPVGPGEFIPVLEQTGMICAVGQWVIKTALAQCRAWRAVLPKLHMSVNISYTQLSQEGIAQQVLDLVEESGLPGDALTLEVTESMQLQDYPHFNKIFYRWKQAGIEISVDDFGTGYSSLGYLKSLEIDEIKIDRCFVSGIQRSAYNYRLLSNLIELARSSQIRVCCEGVETKEELAALEELSPNVLQGFLFDRPLEKEQLERTYMCSGTPENGRYMELRGALRQLKWSKDLLPREMPPTIETLESIVEALDEIVYVSDLSTYELYYLNPAGRRLTGVYDYKGRKCYKVLQGKDDPCEFCTNRCLKKESFHIWEWDNKLLKRHFILKDKLIPWHGKLARLELAVDVSEREIVSQGVREKLDFAENMLTCAKALAEEPDMERATSRMLSSVVEFYQADRAYIFERDPTREEMWNNTYEWCREGVSQEQANLQRIPTAVMQRWIDLFLQDQSVMIPNLDEVREHSPDEWQILHNQGIRRLIASPIYRKGQLTGFLGVDNPRHCIGDDALIRALSLFVVNRFSKNETEERLGELLDLHYQDVLKGTDLGLWFIRIDPNGQRREMFADETMRRVMGLDHALPPQECYEYWYSRVNDGYYQYVDLSVESMIRMGKVVQLEYPWEHPIQGEVMVRCTGVRTQDAKGMICLEGYHRIISDVERPQFLPDTPTGEVFEFNERKGSIYFHTSRQLLEGDAKHEDGFPKSWIDKEIVHPHFAQRFQSLFQNVHSSRDVDGEELLLRSKKGSYDWFKLRIRHLGTDVKDRDTILVLLDAADQERVLQLENLRIRDFYYASLGESIAYAEVDLESGQLKAAGGLWASYVSEYDRKNGSLLQFMVKQAAENIRPEKENQELHRNPDWKSLLSKGGKLQRFRYQRLIDGEWRWVELVAHGFREQFTENMYALLYLKDIDVQVRKERAQQEAANRDPLTGVYNRNAFQEAMLRYMDDSGELGRGALILLDIDNFKEINDRFGHLEGDAALRYVTKVIQATFRRKDLVGRLGGDEFMVFLKGNAHRDILNRRMTDLYDAMGKYPKIPISCSAGIAFVEREGFQYEKSLLQADMALYKSKQGGKSYFSYAEDQKQN